MICVEHPLASEFPGPRLKFRDHGSFAQSAAVIPSG
jgi:hypothetical protein